MTRTQQIIAEMRAADAAHAAFLARDRQAISEYERISPAGIAHLVKAHRRRPKGALQGYSPAGKATPLGKMNKGADGRKVFL